MSMRLAALAGLASLCRCSMV
eukprot:COSAG03_NODE_24430_length_272_cov_0.867052_1_plen_20_part_10